MITHMIVLFIACTHPSNVSRLALAVVLVEVRQLNRAEEHEDLRVPLKPDLAHRLERVHRLEPIPRQVHAGLLHYHAEEREHADAPVLEIDFLRQALH